MKTEIKSQIVEKSGVDGFRQTRCGMCGAKIGIIRRVLEGGQLGGWGYNCPAEDCTLHLKIEKIENWKIQK